MLQREFCLHPSPVSTLIGHLNRGEKSVYFRLHNLFSIEVRLAFGLSILRYSWEFSVKLLKVSVSVE